LREAESLEVDMSILAIPESISYPTSDGETAHALYYPATNPAHTAGRSEQAPLLVKCHGGPTAATSPALDLRTQYWTSRGFGVLDVNYRGSTGYGRHYRQSLYGRWGQADVDDAVYGARYLASEGQADSSRMVIRGGSAGGFTVLCALAFRELFRAGASYYGIGDLEQMFEHTHKFESHYDHQLLGLNGDRNKIFEARSPSRHADRISCPVIFFQGLDDKVVPAEQSEQMVDILRKRGIPVAYLAFAGEGHGFRQAQNIQRALEAELAFYARILGFEPDGTLPSIQIHNLD
jgi:dipeptidyl aminopeptidase/acylaminoacyl peptidase